MGRKLPRGALKLNASLALNRFEQRGADARGVANCINRQWHLAHAVDIIQLLSLSGPGAPVGVRMLGGSGACRWIRQLIRAVEPVGQWGSPAGGRQCDRGEMNGCVYPLLLRGAVSLACDAAGFSFGATRGSGTEHPQFFETCPESSGSVARTISIARLVSPPELDLLAGGQ